MTDQIRAASFSSQELGTKKTTSIKVGSTAVSLIDLPVIVVNGVKDGPTLSLIAGIHGCEYSGIETVIRITSELDPRKLCGKVVAVPVANKPAFVSRVPYVCPIDGINLNRIFPGNPVGSISHRIAHALFNNVISKSDFLIDIHGADLPEELPSQGLVILQKKGDEKTSRTSENLADLFDSEYILTTEIDGSCIGESCKIGIPAVAPEADGAGRIEEKAVMFYKNGIMNVMKYLGMIEGAPQRTTPKKRIRSLHAIRAEQGGLFYPKRKAGEIVSEGELIGEVRNLDGHVEEQILAPISSVITIRMTNVTVNSGDVLLFLGELET